MTCPCALSLATPTAIVAATGALTRLGLLTTRGHALETLARATHVIFDKTGTLTYGRPQAGGGENRCGGLEARRCLALAAALERGSEHPVGRALAERPARAMLRLRASCRIPRAAASRAGSRAAAIGSAGPNSWRRCSRASLADRSASIPTPPAPGSHWAMRPACWPGSN
ncbi:MAG: HAD family hydrolase [Chromatiales bacterium]|nr:HAD family hydrolase [Chromatiales bacterium]